MCKLALKKKKMLSTILGILLPILFGIGGTWLSNKVNAGQLTGAEQQQNAFNAQQAQEQRAWSAEQNQINNQFNAVEAQRNREFQAEQAQNQMDFQERMDNTLYQRRVADMQAAGINPALAIGGVSVGSTSGASGSGSAASASPLSGASASGSGRGVPQSMSDIMQSALFGKTLEQMSSQIQMNDAKTMRDLAEAGLLGEQTIGQHLENAWFVPMNQAKLDNLLSDLDSKEVQRALSRQNISESEARETLTLTQNIIATADASIRDELNRASLRLVLNQATTEAKRGVLFGEQATTEAKRRDEIDAQVHELYARALMESAQDGKYRAEELESFERAGILRIEREVAEAGESNKIKSVQVIRPKLDYYLNKAQQIMDIATTPINVGSNAFSRVSAGLAVGNFGQSYSVPSSRGSSLWLPNGTNSFNMHYNYR